MVSEVKFNAGDHYLETVEQQLESMGISIEPIDRDISSKDLIDYLNRFVEFPNLRHYNLIQKVWFREHAWNLNLARRGDNKLKPDEVVIDWVTSVQQVKHHKEYAETYIIGHEIQEENWNWANAFLKKLAGECCMSEKYSVIKN